MTLVTVFGGTGFLGRHVVERLVHEGATVRVAARHPKRIDLGADAERSGRAMFVAADVRDEETVDAAVAGAQGVVNAVSTYVEKGGTTYTAVHELGAGNIAKACNRLSVGRLVHISGIGADVASHSRYIRARGRGELMVQAVFRRAVILRPSVMFGSDDAFLITLARIVRSMPVIPLIGGGRTKMQPVHVLDVAEAACQSLRNPTASGKIFELGGPESLTLREIVERVLIRTGRRRLFVSIPFALAHRMAQLLEFLPRAPLTAAQVDLLEDDNISSKHLPGIEDLGITPRRLADAITELASR
jgi:NADH dehydrogenase